VAIRRPQSSRHLPQIVAAERIIDHSDDHLANLDGTDYDEVMLRGIGGPECQPRRGTDQGKVT
jgi:hypothetical protein